MARIARSVVALRIFGDDLVASEISTLLGAEPSRAESKGEKIVGKKTGDVRVAKTGLWLLRANDREPEDIDSQVVELFRQISPDLKIWLELSSRFEMNLFCGLFMETSNEGMAISSATLQTLGERGIELQFDIYDPS
jgi:hypothetical protein